MDLRYFLLTKFRGFGSRKEDKITWQCSVFAVLWRISLERNGRIFSDSFLTLDFEWVRVTLSLWCSFHELFSGVSLLDMQRDLHALYGPITWVLVVSVSFSFSF